MRRAFTLIGLAAVALLASAQEVGPGLVFAYGGEQTTVPTFSGRVEALPVLRLVGAQAAFSAAAGTYGVIKDEHVIQFTPDSRHVLVDGELQEAGDAPVASPGGVAVSFDFLERFLLGPLGYHLERSPLGYEIASGARFAEPVAVRPVAADFSATTTLVLTLGHPAEAEVEARAGDEVVIRFADATPHVDRSAPFASRRVRRVTTSGQELVVETAAEVGLLSWHLLDDPPRVIVELGRRRNRPTPPPSSVVTRTTRRPIVLDPGHGGDDNGAVSASGVLEKELVLDIARRLRRRLEADGYPVRLTRDGDEGRALTDRTALANRLEARAFVSLHANASTVSSVKGAETYYMSLDRASTDEAAAATAEVENRASGGEHTASPLDLILWDMAQSEVLNESSELALDVQRRLNTLLGLKDRGVKQAPFVVLTGATMPAILVEVGFLSNREEGRRLETGDERQRLAEAIALGVEDFVRER